MPCLAGISTLTVAEHVCVSSTNILGPLFASTIMTCSVPNLENPKRRYVALCLQGIWPARGIFTYYTGRATIVTNAQLRSFSYPIPSLHEESRTVVWAVIQAYKAIIANQATEMHRCVLRLEQFAKSMPLQWHYCCNYRYYHCLYCCC